MAQRLTHAAGLLAVISSDSPLISFEVSKSQIKQAIIEQYMNDVIRCLRETFACSEALSNHHVAAGL